MSRIKSLLNLLPHFLDRSRAQTGIDTAAPLPTSQGLRLRNDQPFLFCSLREEIRLQFGALTPGQDHLMMRVLAQGPVTLTATVDYRAAMGSSLGRETVTLVSSGTSTSFLPEEADLEHLTTAQPFCLAVPLSPPDGTRAVVLCLAPLPAGGDDVLVVLPSIRIQHPQHAPGNGPPTHAVDAYAFVREGGPSLRLAAKLRVPAGPEAGYGLLTLSDLIGTGPGVARMRRFAADATPLPAVGSDACDRSGRTVFALPRVRKLESPGRSTKTFQLGAVSPLTLEFEIAMIQAGTNGYVNVMGSEIRFLRVQPPAFERMALEDIAAGYYREAMSESDEALVRLRF